MDELEDGVAETLEEVVAYVDRGFQGLPAGSQRKVWKAWGSN
jgi:hypothetical protein